MKLLSFKIRGVILPLYLTSVIQVISLHTHKNECAIQIPIGDTRVGIVYVVVNNFPDHLAR
jgi:hypothetical protein